MDQMRTLFLSLDEEISSYVEPILVINENYFEGELQREWNDLDVKIPLTIPRDILTCDQLNARIIEIQKSIFSDLSAWLNDYNLTNHSNRFWQQVIQHWCNETVGEITRSYEEFVHVIENEEIKKIVIKDPPDELNTTYSSAEFYEYMLGTNFRSALLHTLVSYFSKHEKFGITEKVKFGLDKQRPKKCIENQNMYSENTKKSNFLFVILSTITKLSIKSIFKDPKVFLYETYLNRPFDIRFRMSFRNFPLDVKFNSQKKKTFEIDWQSRAEYLGKKHEDGTVEDFIRTVILGLVPQIFTESFLDEVEAIKKLGFPSNPRIICTGSAFFSNDQFKIWSAMKVENGAKLVILQHGNNFGTMRYPNHPEIFYCDRYVSWGWSGSPNVVSGFYLKQSKQRALYDLTGDILLVEQFRPYNYWSSGFNNNSEEYIQDQYKFLNSLSPERFQELKVRRDKNYLLHLEKFDYWAGWEQNNSRKIEFCSPTTKFEIEASKSRLVVFAYYSTGLIDCMFMNRPAVCFTQGSLNNFCESEKYIFEKLFQAKILHFSSSAAAEHINQSNDEILLWWNSKKVREVRFEFLERHARDSKRPLRDLRKLVLGIE